LEKVGTLLAFPEWIRKAVGTFNANYHELFMNDS